MKNLKSEPIKTCLTIAVGFIVVFLATKAQWAIYVALIIGAIGLFSDYLSQKIDFLWAKLTWVLSLIVPNILLGAIFYLFLFPIALLSKVFKKDDPLLLKNPESSTFTTEHKEFGKESFEKPW